MHHFATPLRPAQQTTSSLRASQYKRKRDDSAEPHDSIDHDAKDALLLDVQPATLHDPLEKEQRRVAGLSFDDAFQVPGPPFPHAPPRTWREKFTSTSVQRELANLSPPIYVVGASSKGQPVGTKSEIPALRKTHLDAHGGPIEPRYNGLWGLGAELLLRRDSPSRFNHTFREDRPEERIDTEDVYSDRGFQLAREYYERLILQYPIRKSQPNAIDATSFYPPLFSVWIMQVLERSRRARRQHKQTLGRSSNASISMDQDIAMTSEEGRILEEEIQNEELFGAREICQRLNQLVESPPYDKYGQLLGLRGHVGLWISDLLIGKVSHEQDHDWDSDSDSNEIGNDTDAATEKIRKLGSGASDETSSNIKMKLNDITKQMAALGSSDAITSVWN
ncbi:hypothetical protein N0V90_009520 [Kalmusia sp. IMI 367209]|nr:hypothetical protein N0V90_009520 [Kalmusia sp. IMI 367209]